ncbi:MAG TPA: hypothetical protein IAC53_00010 [Candidatus Fimenecus excrementigallinarum]|uniref:Oxaloacetate decarboxylase, gamma chain n=1 Tax=Candidatus Fimenecus excrementigallinarum TaxID=2840816 RepID=A0A9D1IDU2_9FIRM|nr:hypothetical protein [Candidatus Fimenecus excrementigallinarum]
MGLLKLAAEGTTQMPLGEALSISGNGMVVVLIVLVVLAVLVLLISKMVRAAQGKAAEESVDSAAAIGDVPAVPAAPAAASAPAAVPLPENQSAGTLELYDCTEKEAAVIMAIVSNESGVPLNRLEFKSIKAIEK